MEVLLILDQSGSMNEATHPRGRGSVKQTKIGTLRKALPIALEKLPDTCVLNIISFGSRVSFMWDKYQGSRPFSGDNRRSAIEYAGSIHADMGGTEILAALEAAVQSCSSEHVSSQIIIITDGEVEPEHVIEFVSRIRQRLQDLIRFLL